MNKNQGFTLIELLVVVLIIGILSSVALPQYQAAVAKSRLSAMIPTIRALKDGMELYYLAHGGYPTNDTTVDDWGFDIDVAQGCTNTNSTTMMTCPNNVYYDRLDSNRPTVAGGNTNVNLMYLMWLDYSDNPGGLRCIAATDDSTANRVCKSMGGVAITGETYSLASTLLKQYTVYKL